MSAAPSESRCGLCVHHRIEGPLAAHAYGLCSARPDPALRAGIATSALATCRIGRFEARKQGEAATPTENAKKEPAA